jgi:phosphoribosylaminoimidazole-succinocarboxamide synthase
MALAIRVNDFLSGVFLASASGSSISRWRPGGWENEMMRIVWRTRSRPILPAVGHQTNDKLDKDRFRRDLGGLLKPIPGRRASASWPRASAAGTGPILVKG